MKTAVVVVLAMAGLVTGCTLLSPFPDDVPDALIGTWEGHAWSSTFDGGIELPLTLTVLPDGHVECTVGDAAFTNCTAQWNRGWLGRTLNIKTEYIIKGGTLDGAIVPTDEETVREFTLPFSPDEDGLHGTIMVLEAWHYPYPLLFIELHPA